MAEENDTPEPGGITDETPDEIRNFVLENAVANKFTVMLKQKPDNGGVAQTLRSFTNWYPNVNTLGRQWGPGSYILVFSWRGSGISGKKETITKEYQIELPDRAWADEHDLYLEEKARARREKKDAEWREEADRNRAMGGHTAAPQVSEIDALKKALELAKSLGIGLGNQGPAAAKPAAEKPQKTFGEKLIDLAPAITAIGAVVGPIAIAIIQRPKVKDDNTLTNTLLSHVLNNKPQENETMKQIVPFLMGTMKQMFDMKDSMQPEEKESMVEKILGKLAPMVPAVLALATLPKEERDAHMGVKMARADQGVQAIAGDPEATRIAVQKLDEAYGFQNANDIISVAGMVRPPDLAENFREWPSPGFGPDGKALDGRDVKVPDGTKDAVEDDLPV